MEIVLRALSAMKDMPGKSLRAVFDAEVKVQSATDTDRCHFDSFRKQFLQGLIDNIRQRLPNDLPKISSVLDSSSWPEDDIARALYGDMELLQLAKAVKLQVCGLSSQCAR